MTPQDERLLYYTTCATILMCTFFGHGEWTIGLLPLWLVMAERSLAR